MRYSIERLVKRSIKKYREQHGNSDKSEIQQYIDLVVHEAQDLYRFWIDDTDYMHIPDPCWGDVKTVDSDLWNVVVGRILDNFLLYDRKNFLKLWSDRSILNFVSRDTDGNFIITVDG